MATTFAYVVFHQNKRKDGSIPVKVRMIHNRKAKYFPTPVFVTKDQLDKKGTKIKDVRITESLDALLREYRISASTITQAPYIDAEQMAALITADMKREKVFRLDFFEYAARKMQDMNPKTAETYKTSINALKRFVGKDTLDISEINHSFILAFKKFLETEPPVRHGKKTYKRKSANCRAVSSYLSCIRAIFNRAIDEYNDDDYAPVRRLPFKKHTIPAQPVTDHRVLTKVQMQQVIAYTPKNELESMAKDVFLLSFYLIGMNTADIYALHKDDLKDGILTYKRAKTFSRRQDKALMQVKVEPEAQSIIDKYIGNDSHLLCFATRYASAHGFNGVVNENLKPILPNLTTYYARHTWATMARNECDIDFDTVHLALNHTKTGEGKITEIYLRRDFSKIWEANRKVVDYVMSSTPPLSNS